MSQTQDIDAQYRKMTETPVSRLILSLAIPTITSMLVTNIYNTGDTYFVSRLGTSASGAVGIVFSLMAFYQAVGFMCGQGSGSFVSRMLGNKKAGDASIYASTGFLAAFCLGALISLFGFLFMNPFLRLLGSTGTILPYARQYGIWIFLAGPFLSSSCVLNNLLRYEGKAVYAMVGLTTGGILNLIGDPIFMFGLKLGVTGAGISTALSQLISFGILLYMVKSGKTSSSIHLRLFQPGFLLPIFSLGFPSLIRQGLGALSTILLNQQAKPYGDAAIAAMSITARIIFFVASVAIGIGQGMQPVAAFNYGAGKKKRVREGFNFTALSGTVLLSGIALLCMLFSVPIIQWFRDDPEVIAVGAAALRWQSISCLTSSFSIASNMLFQSTGHSRQASILALLKNGILFIPLILLLPSFLGVTGIELAQPLADLITALLTIPVVMPFLRSLSMDEGDEGENGAKQRA